MEYKTIFNPSMARQLLKKGNEIKDIKPNKQNNKETVFIFECTEKLLEDLSSISRQDFYLYHKKLSQKEGIINENRQFRSIWDNIQDNKYKK